MRAYLRVDPNLADMKAGYPDGAFRAYVEVLCFAEQQPLRGVFRNRKLLAVLLDKRARWVPFMLEEGDITLMPTGQIVVEGWQEWQEGDYKVHERMAKVRARRGLAPEQRSPGAKRTASYRLRTAIFERDNYTCQYCGVADYPRDWLVLEHVDPEGSTDESNLVAACRPCNKRKGPRTPEQAGMPLLRDTSQAAKGNASQVPVTPSSGKRLAVSGLAKAEAAAPRPRLKFMNGAYRDTSGKAS